MINCLKNLSLETVIKNVINFLSKYYLSMTTIQEKEFSGIENKIVT